MSSSRGDLWTGKGLHYLELANYRQDAIETLADIDGDEFLEMSESIVRKYGWTMHDFYLTLGQYDAVLIVEFPDGHSYTPAILELVESGISERDTPGVQRGRSPGFVDSMGA